MQKNVGLMLKQRSVVSTHLEGYVEPSTNVRATYADMNRLTNRCSSVLHDLGLEPGRQGRPADAQQYRVRLHVLWCGQTGPGGGTTEYPAHRQRAQSSYFLTVAPRHCSTIPNLLKQPLASRPVTSTH